MGADFSQETRSDMKADQIKLKELSPSCIAKLKQRFDKNPLNTHPDKKELMTILNCGKRETDIIFDYFDMDGNGQIDSYEFICAIAMIVHSSCELRSELLFKMYDFDNNNFITRDELVYLMRSFTIASKKAIATSDIEKKTDDFLRYADIDLDKKLSAKEFQSYVSKCRDIFIIMDSYAPLLNSNPMGVTITSASKGGKSINVENVDNQDNDDNNQGNQDAFNSGGDAFDNADQMDPDLFNEMNKDKEAEGRTEQDMKIKQGVEYGMFKEDEMGGDNFGAVKPWITNVVHTVPTNYQPSSIDGKAPEAALELEFIHGYRCHDTRNNLRYTSNGDIVYHSAAVGIVYNKENHTQKFFIEHFDDITALAIHPNKKYVATGEIGPYPLIAVWDTETQKALVRIREPLQKGINHLAFSRDGKYLVATAADDTHNVAIFEWEKGKAEDISQIQNPRLRTKKGQSVCAGPVVGTIEGGRANIFGACFNKTGDTIALTCVKEVNIITFTPGKPLQKKKATGLRDEALTSIMCGAYLNNTLICGSFKGTLLLCAGTSFTKTLKAHTDCINSIVVRENDNGFMTGGNDGAILVWDSKYNITNRLSIQNDKINSLLPKVRSLCEDSNGNILVGCRGGEIIEIAGTTPTVLLRGHFDKELWGLATHPKKNEYYTVGQDQMLAIWDVKTRKIKTYTKIDEPAESIDISPDGKDIVIGCESGVFYIYDAVSLKKKLMKKEEIRKAVEEVKYSPCGQYLAVGGEDRDSFMNVFIYDVTKNYNKIKKMKGHLSRVTHIDWSTDSEYVQSNSQAYELLYHSISSGQQITKISSMKDIEWQTWSCVLGWPVQGIWPECASGDDINACDRDKTKNVVVTGDDFGKVKLFRFPSPVEKASFNQYVGHSSHVTCVRFTGSNSHVISTGGNDKSIFQFKYIHNDQAEEEVEELDKIVEVDHNPDDDQQNEYFKSEEMEGTEFGASKPWIGELRASSPKTAPDKNAGRPPTEGIRKLSYVFGYRAFDTRMNVKYTADTNKIVYHTAALGIVLDKNTNKQTYFTHHKEDIVSLAIHPNGTTVATGQMAAKGEAKLIDLYVWDANKLKQETNCEEKDRTNIEEGVQNLKGCHLRAIRILMFSPDGTKLLSGGQDDFNSVAVHDTSNLNKIELMGTCKVDGARVLDACWIKYDQFVTVGPKHIKFYKVAGRSITPSKGVFGNVPIEPLVSVASAFNKVFTGTSKGNLITWEGSNASTVKTICKDGPVYCLYYYEKDKLLFSGGFDGMIIAYASAKLDEKFRLDYGKITSSPCDVGIRSIDINSKGEMLVGTKGGDIVEINLTQKKLNKFLMKSHYDGELWGLTINPTNPFEVASGGGDKTLRIWDIKANVQKKFLMLPEDFRALDWSSDGKFIIVGTMPGYIYYISVSDMQKRNAFKSIFVKDAQANAKSDKDQWIQELKISPNSQYVAFGSHCGLGKTFSKIQVLEVTSNAENPLKACITLDPKITSALTHLDWSTDNDRIVCNSLAFELKFVSIGAKTSIKASSCVWEPDLWHTWTCLFGYPVQGIWPPACTGYVVNYTCMSNNNKIIATGDDFSLVKFFRCPSVVEQANYKAYAGHSSHVPKVRFTPNDLYLISVGGNDKSVFVWETDFGTPFEGGDDNGDDGDNGDDKREDDNGDQDNAEDEEENMDNQEEGGDDMDEPKDDQDQENQEIEEAEEPVEEEPPKKQQPSKGTKRTASFTEPQTTNAKANTKAKTPQVTTTQKKEVVQSTGTIEVSLPKKIPKAAVPVSSTKKPVAAVPKPVVAKASKQANMIEIQEDDFQADQAGAPGGTAENWRNAIDLPDNIQEYAPDNNPPKISISLDHVFGYRTKDTRNNLRYIKDNIIAYHAGTLGILHNVKTNTQAFFTNHKEEIISFAVDDSRKLIATGENTPKDPAAKPSLIIWDTDLNEIARFDTIFQKGINCIQFSPSGNMIVCTTLDDNHTVLVLDLTTKKIVTFAVGGPGKIFDLCFKSEKEFVSVGIKHFKFWTLKDNELFGKEGVFGETKMIDSKLGLVVSNSGNIITGSSSGQVSLWKDEKLILTRKCHTSKVESLFTKDDYVLTGGSDLAIVIMDKDLTELKKIQLDTKFDSVIPSLRSIDLSLTGNNKILVGTLSSEIFELIFDTDILTGGYTIIQHLGAHYSKASSENNEITGITYWPLKGIFSTISEDNTLRFWNVAENCQVEYLRFDVDDKFKKLTEDNNRPLSIGLEPREKYMAIGFVDGSIKIFQTDDFTVNKIITHRNSPCVELKYSPNGTMLAAACKDGFIDVYSTEDYAKLATLQGHMNPVTKLDWSTDSNYISSSSVGGELLFFNVKRGTQIIRTSDLKNEEWASWTRTCGWPLMGIYDSGEEKINSCERTQKAFKDQRLLAIGDDSGVVKIYKYPCLSAEQKCVHPLIRHGQKITNVKFSDSDPSVLLTTGLDGCIFKWTLS